MLTVGESQNIARWLAEAAERAAKGDAKGARALYLAVLRAEPDNITARLALAQLLLASGMAVKATAELRRLIAAAPKLAGAHFMLGLALKRGKDPGAPAALAEAIRLAPGYLPAYLELAGCQQQDGTADLAEATLRRALRQVGEHPGVLAHLGILLASNGRREAAIDTFERALAAGGDAAEDMHFLHANLAAAHTEAGNLTAAEMHYRKALAANPDFAQGHRDLGIALRAQGRLVEAAAAFNAATRLQRATPWFDPTAPVNHDGSATFTTTSEAKLAHDLQQLRYLRERERLPESFEPILASYQAALADIRTDASGRHIHPLPRLPGGDLAAAYNRMIYLAPAPALAAGCLNGALDGAEIEASYRSNAPGLACIDDFLTPAAFESLRRFCLESTIWFGFKHPGGYLGAYMEEGFCCNLLVQIAEELRQRFPNIFRDHRLAQMWAYKYDSRYSGIGLHADFAAVNVNFWITPDAANEDPEGGGLDVYLEEAPAEWDFEQYNANTPLIREFLAQRNARRVVIPHRQNRAVVFNSNLFHETGAFRFKPGYENRRINITMLFGERQTPSGHAG